MAQFIKMSVRQELAVRELIEKSLTEVSEQNPKVVENADQFRRNLLESVTGTLQEGFMTPQHVPAVEQAEAEYAPTPSVIPKAARRGAPVEGTNFTFRVSSPRNKPRQIQ